MRILKPKPKQSQGNQSKSKISLRAKENLKLRGTSFLDQSHNEIKQKQSNPTLLTTLTKNFSNTFHNRYCIP